MPPFVFMSHDEGAGDIARKHSFTGLKIMVEVPQSLTDTVTEAHDGFEGRPVLIPLWNLRVILGGVSLINIREKVAHVAMVRIIDMRVDSSLFNG